MGAGPPASAHLDSGCQVAQEKGCWVPESDQPRFHSRLQPSAGRSVTSASASLPLKGRDSYSLIHLSELGGQRSGNTKLPCASVSPRVKQRGYWCPLNSPLNWRVKTVYERHSGCAGPRKVLNNH